jgi:hypothetical protein
LAMDGGREEEGVELLRNALVCVPLCEGGDSNKELNVLFHFTDALFHTHAIDEVEPLVARFLELAKVASGKRGRLHSSELQSVVASARLHEVLCTCTQCWETSDTARAFHQGRWRP